MLRWWIKRVGSFVVVLAVMLATTVSVAAPAQAQADRYPTCAAYGAIVGSGGQAAATAAAELQALGAPNPPGLDNVLDVIINGESDVPPIGSRPTADALEIAYQELDGYFGDVCADIDICPLILRAAAKDAPSADAARLARGITAPAPPGIDAALALISGVISVEESPFHDSVAAAQEQIASYFPCEPVATPPSPTVPTDVAATCGDLAVLLIPEGSRAVEAAENLRARGAPNPPGIEAALDVVVAAADFSTDSPPLDQIDSALATLDGYFGGACANLDRCAFVAQIAAADEPGSAEAARLLRRIETPSPPGIDAALALIAGEIDESPFHSNLSEARQQILDYYPCGGDNGGLAFTGTSATVPLAMFGAALVLSGAGILTARRRLIEGQDLSAPK